MPEHYITAGGKRLRCGRTTGPAAAMAAAGRCGCSLTGRAPDLISLNTPETGWWRPPAGLRRRRRDRRLPVEKDGEMTWTPPTG